jgi:MFS family permease
MAVMRAFRLPWPAKAGHPVIGRCEANRKRKRAGREGRRMTTSGTSAPPHAARLLSVFTLGIMATLAMLYIVSQFLRNSVGVIAPNLAAEVGLSPLQIGLLSSIYFFAFAAVQLPLGVALDRFGPKRCMLVSVAITVIGCAVFALAPNAGGLVAGRALLGLGTGCFLIAPLALYARWFAPERFSTLGGIHLGIGSLGALLATAPLAFSTASFGWRATFLGVGVFTVAAGLLAWLIVNDDPPGVRTEPRRESLRESVAGIWAVIRTPSIGRIFLIQLASYPSYILVVGLWGGPYLTHIFGYDLKGRGDILFVAALMQIVGSFFWGPMDRLFGRQKTPILIAGGMSCAALMSLALLGMMPAPLLIGILALLGFSTGAVSLVLAHGRSLVPPQLLGRTMTLLNIGTMGGGFVVQLVSGALIELFPTEGGAYPLEAYRLVFGLQATFMLIALWAYFGSREGHLTRT